MKKKILSLILVTLILISSLPLSILAAEIENLKGNSLPVVSVTSLYSFEGSTQNEFRALPDYQGTFYLDISLDKVPENDEAIVVYYRTVDDTAVSKWGDYEGVDTFDDAYVILSKENSYKARVVIESLVLENGFITPDAYGNRTNNDKIVTRRFLFELTEVEGNAVLNSGGNKSRFYCYLRARQYCFQNNSAQPNTAAYMSGTENAFINYKKAYREEILERYKDYIEDDPVIEALLESSIAEQNQLYQDEWDKEAKNVKYTSFYKITDESAPISTPHIKYKGAHSDNINLSFDDEWKSYVNSGVCDLGISIVGECISEYWDSSGPATFHLYYTYQGERKLAVSIYLQGEFDDSTHLGWEHAFEYAVDGLESRNRDDHMDENFIGFTIYDNNENEAYVVKIKDRSEVAEVEVCGQLKKTLIDGYAVKMLNAENKMIKDKCDVTSYYLKLPSNFVNADSYSYQFIDDSTRESEIRWLEDVNIAFTLIGNKQPQVAKDPNDPETNITRKATLVTTNIEEMKEGDPLRMTVRFDRPVYISDPNDLCYISAQLNGMHNIKLTLKNLEGWASNGSYYYYACDTLVFEGELPSNVQNIKIESIKNIKIEDNDQIRSFFTQLTLLSKSIKDIYCERDFRTPVALATINSSNSWVKSKPIDISIALAQNKNARFVDYVTVYYQWSNSKDLPETFNSKITFHTSKDGIVLKTIIGSGNGEMYLHMKTVSGYGKSSISDMLTTFYDPNVEGAVYTPYGPFNFDNTAPEFSADDIKKSGSLKEPTISLTLPNDNGGVGLKDINLYYIDKNNESKILKRFTADDFIGDPPTLTYSISHDKVGVGVTEDGKTVDENGQTILERREIHFYWETTDKLGNTNPRIADFSLIFDTNDYLETEITSFGPYDISNTIGEAQFKNTTQKIDSLVFIYNYRGNKGKLYNVYPGTDDTVYYACSFTINHSSFGDADGGTYSAEIFYKGEKISNYSIVENENGDYVILFHSEISSGRYDIYVTRTEGTSIRKSQAYSIYATDGEEDSTIVKNKVEAGTLLNNSVYQLSSDLPYFYYKDADGNRKQEYYNGVKQPATFSSFEEAKRYVYYMELSDIYLIQLTSATANALSSGTTGYLIAKGENVTPQAGQYWIRYKSDAWTPNSGDSAWVYYYYGSSAELSEASLSAILQSALNTVANRIASYGKYVTLTDTSLFLGTASGNKMLDEYGIPYLLEEQIHSTNEMSDKTKCGNTWSISVFYAADKNIYKSDVYVGLKDSSNYEEFPIVGNFQLSADSQFQYMTYDEYKNNVGWKMLNIKDGQSFINYFEGSGVYYIREMSIDGVSVFAIYIDKEAPKVTFTNTNDTGEFQEIPVDSIEILDIRTKDLYIGSIAATEYDRLSYVAVYKISNLDLIGIYTADQLEHNTVKLDDGNYYIVVADRSGNHYTITAKISSSDLDCQIKESPDRFIRLTCNRRNDQILRYEVYLNGVLVSKEYVADQTFDKAGLYTIYIQDIYGNVYTKEYVFNRNYPTVTWKYLASDGKYHEYNAESPDANGFIMTWTSDNQYKISTSVKTRFTFNEDYEFEFIGTEPSYTKTFGTETVVTIEAGQSFTLKVYYRNHKDCFSIYTGVVDVIPPSINVSAEIDIVSNGEYDLFDSWIADGNIDMNNIFYVLDEIGHRNIFNGGSVSSDSIKINASDANELSLVEVYLDGTLIKKQDRTSGFSQIIVSQWGSYRVVAKDALGNVSEFTFKNGMPDGIEYSIDGTKTALELHGYLNFKIVDGKYVYTKVNYGKSQFKIDIKENADIFMSVGIVNGNTEIYGFRVADGKIYPLTYTIVFDRNGEQAIQLTVGEAIFDITADDFKFDNEYLINKDGAYSIFASISSSKTVTFKVYAPENSSDIVSINARIEFVGSTILFVSSELSQKSSNIAFTDGGIQSNTDIKSNQGFTVDESFFESERIASIKLYYSNLNDLDVNSLSGRKNIYVANKQYTDEGFYLLIVKNLYGNEKVYNIAISRNFGVTSSVTFGDSSKIHYSKDYTGKLYSNNEIILDILDENVKYEVTLNGFVYTGYQLRKEDIITYLVFSQEGTYEVKLTDSYGNVIVKHLEINKSSYTIDDKLLTGYNEKALKRNEGYTNQKLTIDKTVYDNNGIYYLAIKYGENITVLFDAFAETPITTDAQRLIDIIGAQGDGVYTIICRNRYGAIVTKDIHYRGTPTLSLERTTRSQSDPEIYDLSYAISMGFWSNNTLIFKTEASTYVFTVNGSVTDCPRIIAFDNAGDYGSAEYEITYIDEYGFEYKFKAYLVRKNITIDIPSSITGIEINGILNTQNDISVTFGENIYATYIRNNGEEVVYHSGDVLKKDGTYKFIVTDYAGNSATLTIKKDTAVEFAFIESNTSTAIQNGSVINSSKVSLDILNKDSVHIEKVLRNGVIQTDFSGTRFTDDGKWELILSDDLGNKAYFYFYIITHSQNGFSYTTPYEYRITEMWYDSGDGVKISYMNFVNHTDYTSSFSFNENGKYTVVMTSDVTGITSTFDFTINTTAPDVSLVGCNIGETTINDVSLTGCKVGDRIKIYKTTDNGEVLVQEIEVTSQSTKMPTITEGGKYRIVVESEAGVSTELTFVRKHVMNTAGSIFIIVIIAFSVIGLFTGLVYRNKSKTDD